MGYGEFGGGGSVYWKIKHTKGDSGDADEHGGHGKDKEPDDNEGIFTVFVEEKDKPLRQMSAPVNKDTKVTVTWSALSTQVNGAVGMRKSGTAGKKK